MSEVIYTKSQEEYEDDFERDLDWLISEESRSEDQAPNYEDIEAEIDKELEEQAKRRGVKMKERGCKKDSKLKKMEQMEEDEERWPSPMEPLEYDSDGDSPRKSPNTDPPPVGNGDQTDEEKKYVLEKIQQANRELQDQEAPDATRRRRLHFKETLVDLVVPPFQFEKISGEVQERKVTEDRADSAKGDTEVSGKLSELKLSPRNDIGSHEGSSKAFEGGGGGHLVQEGKVLVEKDGKFDLVNLTEVESQSLLPPIPNHFSDSSGSSPRATAPAANPTMRPSVSSLPGASFNQGIDHIPRPPAKPRSRPSSASHSLKGSPTKNAKRRVHSATGTPSQATYTLSPQQKETLQKIQERRENLAREAEQRKREEDEMKRQENELAFKAWLMRKREQLQEERRIHRAQEMERMNCKKDASDPEEAFRLWLQKKHEQQQKEKQLMELKRLEEDGRYLLHSREECERAFKLWLRRKRLEKKAEQHLAREHSRRLVLEERRARRMRDLVFTANENKPFRFTEQLSYHF